MQPTKLNLIKIKSIISTQLNIFNRINLKSHNRFVQTVPQDTLNILMKGSDINFPELAINPEKNIFQHKKSN